MLNNNNNTSNTSSPSLSPPQAYLIRFEGGLVLKPLGNKKKQRQELHKLAWQATAKSLSIIYPNHFKFSSESLCELAQTQAANNPNNPNNHPLSCLQVDEVTQLKNTFYERISSGVPVEALLDMLRSKPSHISVILIGIYNPGISHEYLYSFL